MSESDAFVLHYVHFETIFMLYMQMKFPLYYVNGFLYDYSNIWVTCDYI